MSAFSSVLLGLGVGPNFKPLFNNLISADESSRDDKFIILGSTFACSSTGFSVAAVVDMLHLVFVVGWVAGDFSRSSVLKNSFHFRCVLLVVVVNHSVFSGSLTRFLSTLVSLKCMFASMMVEGENM